MGKRFWSLALTAALVAGVFTVLPAKAQATGEKKFFLSSTGCSAADTNFDFLTVTDAEDAVECFYTGAGLRSDIGEAVGNTPASSDRETATRRWDTVDGNPLVLDASGPVTGEIYTSGGQCPLSGVCSPAGLSGGQVIIEIGLVGTTQGKEVELGTQTDEFETVPGSPHLTELSIQPDASLGGLTFDAIELRTWIHGVSAGHGVIKTTGDANSFISVPTASGATVKPPKGKVKPPGKSDPPGKGEKKGCTKGKGKKKGACPGKKPPKPPAAPSCPAYTPGEEGAEAEASIVTDAATAEAPLEVTIAAPPGVPEVALGHVFHNIQVDTAGAESGLYVAYEFPVYEDHDIYLNYASGTEAAHAGGFNPAPVPVALGCCDGTGTGGHSEQGAEFLDGVRSADCSGYTLDMASFASEGGDMTLKLWLGEATYDPAADSAPSAMEMFYRALGL